MALDENPRTPLRIELWWLLGVLVFTIAIAVAGAFYIVWLVLGGC